MTRIFFMVPALAGLIVAAGLFAGSPAAAQIVCPVAADPGPPVLNAQHIFCGETNGGVARGFHSRPGGLAPAGVAGGVLGPRPGAPAGIQQLVGFTIGGLPKALSTLFPDNCTQANVVAAVRNVYNTGGAGAAAAALAARTGGNASFTGFSGATCRAGVPLADFRIRVVVTPAGQILTAYPDY
jgi:hypothetical protein